MPTSAGPNTYGEENLVFGYDLGDVSNSYKGEPTTNIITPFPSTVLPAGVIWTYEYSASISDSPVGNHFLSNQKWVKFTKTSSTNGRAMFLGGSFTAGNTYTWTMYVYCDDSRNTSFAMGSDNANYSQTTTSIGYNFSNLGTVQRIRGTWNQLLNGGSIFGVRGGTSNPVGSTIYVTGLQCEQKANPTQLTTGTRSATQGLIDLTGNSTINISTVSFDSNAQVIFDGTDDSITCGTPAYSNRRDFTFVAWVKSDGVLSAARRGLFNASNMSTGYISFFGYTGGVGSLLFETRDSTNNAYLGLGSQAFNIYSGEWVMVGFQIKQGALALFYHNSTTFYYNETADSRTGNFSFQNFGAGSDSSAFRWDGYIDGVRFYDRVLTQDELKANFKALKTRFI